MRLFISLLDLDGGLKGLAALLLTRNSFGTHDTTAPVTLALLVLVAVALLDGGGQLGEFSLVLGAGFGQSNGGSSLDIGFEISVLMVGRRRRNWRSRLYLLVDNGSKTSLALDDGIGNTHLAAEGGHENNHLDGIDIIRNENQRSFLVLNQAHDVVETVLDSVRLLADILLLLALGDGGRLLVETLLLLGLGFRAVLVQKLEGLRSGVAVQGVLELRDGWRDFEAEVHDLLLALETDIFGPLHHAREVTLGLDVLADTEVARALLDEWVLNTRSKHVNFAISKTKNRGSAFFFKKKEKKEKREWLTLAVFLLVPAFP